MGRPRIPQETRIFNEAVGRRIVLTREALGMTAGDLAKTAGLSAVTLCRYESGDKACLPEAIRRLADALGISTGALIPRFAKRSSKSTPKRG